MRRSRVIKLLLATALAASTIGLAASAAIAGEGRSPGTNPGSPEPSIDEIFGDPRGWWDQDGPQPRDQVILDDLIVDGSICAGLDCVNGESFGFDTIRLKENNLRIRFVDTSSTASFPSNDWQITANDSSNGGANKFSIDDIDGGRTPFTIEASAPSHSLYVDDGGRLGFGTNTPVTDLHVKSGNTPTLRLEQDGSSGFTPQTWDVAGNEAGFFIRDATNGSTLPFRIRPGAASSSIDIQADSDVCIGCSSPVPESQLTIVSDGGNRGVLWLQRSGAAGIAFEDTGGSAETWSIGTNDDGTFTIALSGTGNLFTIDSSGNVTVTGTLDATPGGTN